jgi:MT0933-like antitoxin protein
MAHGSEHAQEGVTVKFADKFKDLRKQAQTTVAENREKIHDAVDVVSTTVDQKTGGKHTAKIAKFGEQAGAAVDRFSEGEGGGGPSAGDGSLSRTPASEGAPRPSGGSTPPAGGEAYGGTPPAFDE